MVPGRIGRFEVLRELAESAHGGVYKCVDPSNGKIVVIRNILLEPPYPSGEKLRVIQEAPRRAFALDSPNIVRVQEVGQADDALQVVTEYVEGNTLAQLLERNCDFSVWEVIDLARQVCVAIDHAHSREVSHRNLNPANLMVEWDGTVKIMDYGVALDAGEAAEARMKVAALHYLSPEQARGEEPDRRANLFSLAAILYELLSGSKAFAGREAAAILKNIATAEPEPPQLLKTTVNARLGGAIMKALSKAPSERYQSGAEFIRDLEKSQAAVVAPKTPDLPRGPHKPTDKPKDKSEDKSEDKSKAVSPPMPAGAAPGRQKPVVTATRPDISAPDKLVQDVPLPGTVAPVAKAPTSVTASVSRAKPPEAVNAQKTSPEFLIVGPREIPTPAVLPSVPKPNSHPSVRRFIRLSVINRRSCYAAAGVLLVIGSSLIGYLGFASHAHSREQQLPPEASQQIEIQPATQIEAAESGLGAPSVMVTEQQALRSERATKSKQRPAVSTLPAITTGELIIDSTPQGALIQVDGQSGSATPYTSYAVTAGPHTITWNKPGYVPESRTVEVAAGQKSYVAVSLKGLGATVSIASDPAGNVQIDGHDTGRTTPLGVVLPKGSHTITVRRPGFLSASTTVELTPGQVFQYSPRLLQMGDAEEVKSVGKLGRIFGHGPARSAGKLLVRSDPKGARIKINERVLDKPTPAEFAVPAGSYQVTLTLAGHKPVQRTITVAAGAFSTIDEPLPRE